MKANCMNKCNKNPQKLESNKIECNFIKNAFKCRKMLSLSRVEIKQYEPSSGENNCEFAWENSSALSMLSILLLFPSTYVNYYL